MYSSTSANVKEIGGNPNFPQLSHNSSLLILTEKLKQKNAATKSNCTAWLNVYHRLSSFAKTGNQKHEEKKKTTKAGNN